MKTTFVLHRLYCTHVHSCLIISNPFVVHSCLIHTCNCTLRAYSFKIALLRLYRTHSCIFFTKLSQNNQKRTPCLIMSNPFVGHSCLIKQTSSFKIALLRLYRTHSCIFKTLHREPRDNKYARNCTNDLVSYFRQAIKLCDEITSKL